MRALFFAIAMLIVGGQQSVAQQNSNSGAALLNACKLLDTSSNENLFLQGVCSGIVGAVYFHFAGVLFCPPDGVTRAQNSRVVTQYVERNPQIQNLNLAELAERAFKEAWPCPAQQQRR